MADLSLVDDEDVNEEIPHSEPNLKLEQYLQKLIAATTEAQEEEEDAEQDTTRQSHQNQVSSHERPHGKDIIRKEGSPETNFIGGGLHPIIPTSPRITRMISRSEDDCVSHDAACHVIIPHVEQNHSSTTPPCPIYASVVKRPTSSSCQPVPSSSEAVVVKTATGNGTISTCSSSSSTMNASPIHSHKSNGKSCWSRNNSFDFNSSHHNKNNDTSSSSSTPTLIRKKNNNGSSLSTSNVNHGKRSHEHEDEIHATFHGCNHYHESTTPLVTTELFLSDSIPLPSSSLVLLANDQQYPQQNKRNHHHNHPRYSHTSSSNEASSSTTPASSEGLLPSSKISSSGYNSHEESDREQASSSKRSTGGDDAAQVIRSTKKCYRDTLAGTTSKSDKTTTGFNEYKEQSSSPSAAQNKSLGVKLRSKSNVQSKSLSSSPKHTVKSSHTSHHYHHNYDPKRDSIASVSEKCSLLCCKFFK